MTRIHFEAIAAAVKCSKLTKAARKELVQNLVNELFQFNNNFKADKFREACGVPS